MSPYEIGLSFDSLTKNGFFSVEELAAKIGKSIRYVYKMLTTVKLPQELTGLLETRVLNDATASRNSRQRLPNIRTQRTALSNW